MLLILMSLLHIKGDFVPGFIQSRDDLEPKFLAMERFLHCNGFRQILERDAGGFTPLCYAAINGDAQVVEALLEMKANPNDRITKGGEKPEGEDGRRVHLVRLEKGW